MKLLILILVLASTPIAFGQEPHAATLTEQKMCEEQARTKFHEDYDGTKGFEYTSHFDARASVCYIMVHEAVNSGSPIVSFLIYDAFEGRVYASYRWMNSEHKKYEDVAPMECSVKPRGQAEIVCKTSAEFEDLADKYFGIGR